MVLKIWFVNTLGTSVFISHSYTLHIRHFTYIKDKETVRGVKTDFFKFKLKNSFSQSLAKTFEKIW